MCYFRVLWPVRVLLELDGRTGISPYLADMEKVRKMIRAYQKHRVGKVFIQDTYGRPLVFRNNHLVRVSNKKTKRKRKKNLCF